MATLKVNISVVSTHLLSDISGEALNAVKTIVSPICVFAKLPFFVDSWFLDIRNVVLHGIRIGLGFAHGVFKVHLIVNARIEQLF